MTTSPSVMIREIDTNIITFTVPFNRFAPFGYRNFVAVGNRATAIRLTSGSILLLNPIPLTEAVRNRLDSFGGVHFIAADLGHHLSVSSYLNVWPNAKTIGVPGLEKKRDDVRWDWIYGGDDELGEKPEEVFGWEEQVETVLFEGFITCAVAWWIVESKTLIVSDLLMNMPATEQYNSSSADRDILSREFSKRAHPKSVWFKRLIYYVASVDYSLMRRDVKRVAEWDIERIIPCHGDVIKADGNQAWRETYRWFLEGNASPGFFRRAIHAPFMKAMRWFFLT